MSVDVSFDGISEGYTGKISRWVPDYFELIAGIPNNLPEHFRARNILDLGCGDGNVTALLLKKFPEANFTLVDASSEMIASSRNRFSVNPNINFVKGFFQEVDFEENNFDLIVAGLSLHHLKGTEKAPLFKAIARWLTSEGYFSVSDFFIDKDDEPRHSEAIEDWKTRSAAQGTTPEDWDWVMDHYEKYDNPDGFEKQFLWLSEAGLGQISTPWKRGCWANVLVQKG